MILEKEGPGWLSREELPVWILIGLFLVIAFFVFWVYGFSRLPFPV